MTIAASTAAGNDTADVIAFARTLAERWQALLGASLLNVRLIGSLAHGGFSRRYSDVDIAAIGERGFDPAELEAMRQAAAAISGVFAGKLSIFWSDRTFSVGRFPPLDRADFIDYGVPLFERTHLTPPRPGLAELRTYLAGRPFAAWAESAGKFAALDRLDPSSHKSYLRAQLYPARLVYSFMTGRMGSNDMAVEWLAGNAPPGLDVAVIAAALDCRRANADPDPLFAARTVLPRQVAACAALIRDSADERP